MNTGRRISLLWVGTMACFFTLFGLVSHGNDAHVVSSEAEAESRPIWLCNYGNPGGSTDFFPNPVTHGECMQAMINLLNATTILGRHIPPRARLGLLC